MSVEIGSSESSPINPVREIRGGSSKETSTELDLKKTREVARNFESLFFDIVLKSMRKTVQKSELMDGGNSEEIYRSMLDSEYAKAMSTSGQSGLSVAIEKQMLESMSISQEKVKAIIGDVTGKKLYSKVLLPTASNFKTIK